MSTTPFNNFRVNDLTSPQNTQPYVNSTVELGYFDNGFAGTTSPTYWTSMPTVLLTNNGIAIAAADNTGVNTEGLSIKSAGVYKLNLTVYITSGGNGGAFNAINFNFGSQALSQPDLFASFGGSQVAGQMLSYSNTNTNYPGIISWNVDSYSSGNNGVSGFSLSNNQLRYSYFSKVNNTGLIYPGICTTEITFVLNAPTIIFFIVQCDNAIQMGRSYFTLELITTNFF